MTDEPGRTPYEGACIGSFRDIAAQACQRKIRGNRGTVMFPADDVIHLKGEGCIALVDEAVFADAHCPFDDGATQTCWHMIAHAAVERRPVRALAFARLMTWSS